jgi:hypothetical protein
MVMAPPIPSALDPTVKVMSPALSVVAAAGDVWSPVDRVSPPEEPSLVPVLMVIDPDGLKSSLPASLLPVLMTTDPLVVRPVPVSRVMPPPVPLPPLPLVISMSPPVFVSLAKLLPALNSREPACTPVEVAKSRSPASIFTSPGVVETCPVVSPALMLTEPALPLVLWPTSKVISPLAPGDSELTPVLKVMLPLVPEAAAPVFKEKSPEFLPVPVARLIAPEMAEAAVVDEAMPVVTLIAPPDTVAGPALIVILPP